MPLRRMIPVVFWLALAGGGTYLFTVRYWLYRDCIAAAASSCVTPDGTNLTEGGIVWGIMALVFLAIAALARWRRWK